MNHTDFFYTNKIILFSYKTKKNYFVYKIRYRDSNIEKVLTRRKYIELLTENYLCNDIYANIWIE